VTLVTAQLRLTLYSPTSRLELLLLSSMAVRPRTFRQEVGGREPDCKRLGLAGEELGPSRMRSCRYCARHRGCRKVAATDVRGRSRLTADAGRGRCMPAGAMATGSPMPARSKGAYFGRSHELRATLQQFIQSKASFSHPAAQRRCLGACPLTCRSKFIFLTLGCFAITGARSPRTLHHRLLSDIKQPTTAARVE
jgi:hypothetical protein